MMTPHLIGRYEIVDELGRGGMATVYRAFDPQFEREVAVKVLPREFLHDPAFRARFEREARTVARLEHYAIVPVHDFGEHEGQPYLVMRYMPGGSLAERIEGGWPVALEGAAVIARRIGAALDAAHRQGVIHRDVKSANVLFDGDGVPYLTDFGIVKLTEATAQITGSGLVGTPAYMAPEMAQSGGLTPLVDVYALGVVLYQMLSGQLPYEADTPIGLLMAHIGMPIPDIRACCPHLPAAVQDVIERALAKDPADRYQRAGELAEALADAAAVDIAPEEEAPPFEGEAAAPEPEPSEAEVAPPEEELEPFVTEAIPPEPPLDVFTTEPIAEEQLPPESPPDVPAAELITEQPPPSEEYLAEPVVEGQPPLVITLLPILLGALVIAGLAAGGALLLGLRNLGQARETAAPTAVVLTETPTATVGPTPTIFVPPTAGATGVSIENFDASPSEVTFRVDALLTLKWAIDGEVSPGQLTLTDQVGDTRETIRLSREDVQNGGIAIPAWELTPGIHNFQLAITNEAGETVAQALSGVTVQVETCRVADPNASILTEPGPQAELVDPPRTSDEIVILGRTEDGSFVWLAYDDLDTLDTRGWLPAAQITCPPSVLLEDYVVASVASP